MTYDDELFKLEQTSFCHESLVNNLSYLINSCHVFSYEAKEYILR